MDKSESQNTGVSGRYNHRIADVETMVQSWQLLSQLLRAASLSELYRVLHEMRACSWKPELMAISLFELIHLLPIIERSHLKHYPVISNPCLKFNLFPPEIYITRFCSRHKLAMSQIRPVSASDISEFLIRHYQIRYYLVSASNITRSHIRHELFAPYVLADIALSVLRYLPILTVPILNIALSVLRYYPILLVAILDIALSVLRYYPILLVAILDIALSVLRYYPILLVAILDIALSVLRYYPILLVAILDIALSVLRYYPISTVPVSDITHFPP
ncbi:hypothetical protein RRG08_034064 [Elysia crispata]|uniref:Uncharacterized protein n=1 Tax=Elysia crispata TaxID=231223 RepID=A0AAE0YKF0_9GAST|nr:hypothetical protein RRG08_034064 [Elysia crispata]